MPEISVIMPVYNVEKYLRECLDSLLAQTFTDFEAICVNDGSTDGSLTILEEYAAKDHRFKIISQANRGLSAARNTGISNAVGKYIFFLDSDDYIAANALEKCFDISEREQLDELIFDCFWEFEIKTNSTTNQVAGFNSSTLTGKELFVSAIEKNHFRPMAWLRFFKREFLLANNLYFCIGLLHEDTLFSVQADVTANTCRYISDKLYYYRVRANSIMTGSKALKRLISYAFIHKEISKIAIQKCDDNILYNALNQRLFVNIVNAKQLFESLDNNEFCNLCKSDLLLISDFISILNILQKLQQKIDAAYLKSDIASEKLDIIINHSLSYKIGQVITWLPRKIKGIFKHD